MEKKDTKDYVSITFDKDAEVAKIGDSKRLAIFTRMESISGMQKEVVGFVKFKDIQILANPERIENRISSDCDDDTNISLADVDVELFAKEWREIEKHVKKRKLKI